MSANRNYSSISAAAVLTSGCSNVDTTIQADTVSGFPSVPYILCLDKDRVGEELVLVTAVAGLALTVTRGYGGTSAVSHSAGATVRHVFTGVDAQEFGDHIGDDTLHVSTTSTLAPQWAKPGAWVAGLTTGTPVTISSAGPTSILAGPASGRRIVKQILITGAKGATVTVTAASVNIAKFTFSNGTSDPAKQTGALGLALPIANGESVTATVASGAATFTPVYADRADTLLDRRGLTSGSGTGTIVASGTARTITQLWVANTGSVTATGSVLRAGTAIIDSVSLAAGGVLSLDDPFTITSSQALTYSGDSTTALTYFAVGI